MNNVFRIANDFYKRPSGRYKTDGKYTAEHLREIIIDKLKSSDEKLFIDISGLSMFSSPFIDECFGGMIRNNLISKDELLKRIEFISDEYSDKDKSIIEKILTNIDEFKKENPY